ncbi:hypothetical protein MMC30_000294 [Trapelia coarctata]|nr:hypothetical protein [Trapelia coarctata]
MPHSPRTPHRKRPPSSLDLSFTSNSPQSTAFTLIRPSRSRKSSIQSLRTPTTPRPPSSYDRAEGFSFSNEYGDAGNGLGSLADELAEAWDEDEEDVSGLPEVEEDASKGQSQEAASPPFNSHHDMGAIGLSPSPVLVSKPNGSPVPQKKLRKRLKDTDYDGSDYGDNSDLEESGITPQLEARMAVVESLARQGAASTGTEADQVFSRVASHLRDLSSQASVENHTTRLATAHTALTSHLTYQTRLLQALTHPLLSPLSLPPSAETVDALLPLLSSLILALPQPPETPLPALHALYTSTIELSSTLSYLSDNLHLTRQTTTLASRRLRAAREAVGTMKREIEEAEAGERWLEIGGWNERLKDREAARVCGEVVGGFEEVCKGWRERLVRQGGGEVEVGAA